MGTPDDRRAPLASLIRLESRVVVVLDDSFTVGRIYKGRFKSTHSLGGIEASSRC